MSEAQGHAPSCVLKNTREARESDEKKFLHLHPARLCGSKHKWVQT